MKTDCIFCKIIAGQIPTKPFADYDDILVIRDIAPKAPTHLLIMPKKHIHDLAAVDTADMGLVARMMTVAQDIARKSVSPATCPAQLDLSRRSDAKEEERRRKSAEMEDTDRRSMGPEVGAFRLMINNGAQAGQSVFHLHMHFLAGKQMSE